MLYLPQSGYICQTRLKGKKIVSGAELPQSAVNGHLVCLQWNRSPVLVDVLSPVNHKHLNLFVGPRYENLSLNFSMKGEKLIKCLR